MNALGYLRVMFAVDDIDDTLARLGKHGAQLVSSEVVDAKNAARHQRNGTPRRDRRRVGKEGSTVEFVRRR